MLDRLLQVQDDPKLPDDSGEVPKPHKVVGGLIPGHGIVSLLDKNYLGGQAFHVFRKTKKSDRLLSDPLSQIILLQCNKVECFFELCLGKFFHFEYTPTSLIQQPRYDDTNFVNQIF